jgi:hypothetical protein
LPSCLSRDAKSNYFRFLHLLLTVTCHCHKYVGLNVLAEQLPHRRCAKGICRVHRSRLICPHSIQNLLLWLWHDHRLSRPPWQGCAPHTCAGRVCQGRDRRQVHAIEAFAPASLLKEAQLPQQIVFKKCHRPCRRHICKAAATSTWHQLGCMQVQAGRRSETDAHRNAGRPVHPVHCSGRRTDGLEVQALQACVFELLCLPPRRG